MNHIAQTMRVIDRPGHTTGYVRLLCTGQGLSWYSNETFLSKEPITCPKCLEATIGEKELFEKESRCRLTQAIAYMKAYESKDYKLAMEIEHDHWNNFEDQENSNG